MTTARDLDTSGLKCPLPVLKARKTLAILDPGERLRLIATDPSARIDVPAFCMQAGHRLIEAHEEGATLVFVIEKT